MMNNFMLLAVNGDDLQLGFQALVIGVVMVFLILGLLVGVVCCSRKIAEKVENITGKKKVNDEASPIEEVISVDNKKLVAAITAAITLMVESEVSDDEEPLPFVVREIRKIN